MIGIDLFAGAGGMSLGATAAGIEIALAVEADPHAAATYAHNHPDTPLFHDDIRKLTSRRLKQIDRKGKETIVFGGPPCQGFSYSNQRTRSQSNPGNWLFLEFMRVVETWKPDWVVFENVIGITNTEGGLFLNEIMSRLQDAGYAIAQATLDAADFRVAQHRQRLFIVGSCHGHKFSFPKASKTDRISVMQAIADLPKLENGASEDWLPYRTLPASQYAALLRKRLRGCKNHLVSRNAAQIIARYRHIPEGGNWEDIPARLMRNYADRSRCHTGIYHRLHGRHPSIVIGNFRKNMLIHPNSDRGLSVREAARIQSFPDSYEFVGSIGFQQQQVGNAVPPLLAGAVFRQILIHTS